MEQYSLNERSVARALDVVCIIIAQIGAWALVSWLHTKGLFVYPIDWSSQSWRLLVIAAAGWIAASSYTRLYRVTPLADISFAVRRLVRTLCLYALIMIGSLFVIKLQNVSRQLMGYALLFSGCSIWLRHWAAEIYHDRLRRFGHDWRTALVVGTDDQCRRFVDLFPRIGPSGFRIVPAPIDYGDGYQAHGVGTLHDLPEADDAFVLPGGRGTDRAILRLLQEGKAVHLVPELFDARLFRRTLGELGGAPLVSLWNGRLSRVQACVKRTADIVGSILLLTILSPLMIIIGALIKLTSPGPVWFTQRRLGKSGRPFDIYKFRTMVADAETVLRMTPGLYEKYVANNYKLPKEEDPRITCLGGLLRATSLDELPQLVNVLKGEMSLVGPRPIVVAEVEMYRDYAKLFLSAKPGMTGHWQVSGRSDVMDYGQRVALDLEYLRDQSLGKDFEILLRTVPSVLLRKGAH
jgi:exopolysaccharide biosynthesis polyprenyl glycosylphosphotransferase